MDERNSVVEDVKDCLRCGRPVDTWLHACVGKVPVLDPVLYNAAELEAEPTMAEVLEEQGVDVEAEMRHAENEIKKHEAAYLNGPLTYRLELHNFSGLGFQGGFDYASIAVEGRTDSDLRKALDFINADRDPLFFLNREDIYFCRLISWGNDRIRYVWKIKRLKYNEGWELSDF